MSDLSVLTKGRTDERWVEAIHLAVLDAIVLLVVVWRTFGDLTKTWWQFRLLTQTIGHFC